MKKIMRYMTPRIISLVLAIVVMITAIPASIAIDVINGAALGQQTFTLTPEEGVTVVLSGIMPVNGSADAEPVDTEDGDVLHAYDITIRYPDGKEFEPDSSKPINVSFQSDLIADAIEDDEELEVAHIPDNGKEESVELTKAQGDTAYFEAESFSVYLIRKHTVDIKDPDDSKNVNPRRIYHFLSPDFTYHENEQGVTDHYCAPAYEFPNKLNDMVTTQAIRSGESLQEIVMPKNDNSGLFYGWYVVECDNETEDIEGEDGVTRPNYIYRWGTGTPQRVEFNEPINFPDATDDEDIYLAPLFGRYRFLTFHQDTEGSDNENMIVSRKLIVLNDERKCELEISDVRAPSVDPNKIIFWGWEFTHIDGDDREGYTEKLQTVTTEGEEIPQTITIQDRNVINGYQPTDEDLRHMIYDIWPIFKEARWVEFDTGGNGATYRPPQFILLENDTTGFNNVPTRSGYDFNGWYYGTEDNMVTDSNANILTGVTKQLTTGMSIENGKLVITTDAEGSSANRVFHAKWTPVTQAEFHVIVWKQKVTDSKYAGQEGYPAKTYDFAGYYDNLSGATGTDPRQTDAYNNFEGNGFEHLDQTRNNQNAENNFIGFHYSRLTVSDSGYNHPTYENKVNPDGSTVVNVYYDRDLMKITFHYRSNDLSGGTTSGGYYYKSTDDNYGDQYGLVNGSYVPLDLNTEFVNQGYSFSAKYNLSTAENEIMYRLVNGEYVKLTSEPIYQWKTAVTSQASWYSSDKYGYYLPTTSNNGDQYGIFNGDFNELYLNNNKWYQNRSGLIFHSYSNEYTGTRYTLNESETSSKEYSGKRYKIINNQLTETTDTTGTLYGVFDNGRIYLISRTDTIIGYNYFYNGELYTGDRYAIDTDNTFYHGTLYKKTANGFVETTDESGTLYGTRNDGIYEVLTSHTAQTAHNWKTPDGSIYTGTRYIRYKSVNDDTYPYELEWEGLYGSSFSDNGYIYPTQYRWIEGKTSGTSQTLLSSFTKLNDNHNAADTDYHLYHNGNVGSKTIYHLCQNLDGTYTRDDPALCYEARTSSSTFYFENKFTGFTVYGYSKNFYADPESVSSGFTKLSGSNPSTSTNFTYIYHKRNDDIELLFNSNYNGGENHSISNLYYGQSIAGYADVYTPEPRAHYTFGGWYEDSTCTQPFNFDTTITASKIIYAKWIKERYRVMVDPDGGEMPLGTSNSTFFNVDFDELVGEYGDIRREYVEASDGDYVYANFQYDKVNEFPGVAAKPKGLAAVYRKAFYIKKNEIDAAYNSTFTVNGDDYSYADSGMTLEEFKSCIDMNTLYNKTDGTITYELVSWHRVRSDGTVEQIPFNFKNQLTEDTTIRARWVQHGGYSLVYNPTMTSTGITGTMDRVNDPLDDQRKYADKAPVIILGKPINLTTTGAGGHEEDADDYTFRGWRIVDADDRQPLENSVFYNPGETMILNARLADHQGVIHMEAYYEKRASTVRRPDVAALTLDANSSTASVNAQELVGDKKEYADVLNKQVKLERQINNFNVDLKKYIKNFTNSDGSLLLGWNTTSEAGTYIPEYYADAEIGVNKQNAASPPSNINTLYALWEPMIYLTLDNTTTQDMSFNLTFNGYGGTVYSGYVNTMTGVYERTPFSDESFVTKNSSGNFTVTLPKKKSIQLVVPEGMLNENQPGSYTITGNYATSNTAKNLYVYNSGATDGVSIERNDTNNVTWELNGQTTNANPISYTSTGTLIKGSQGRLVRFTEENESIKLNLTARYYDVDAKEWKNADSNSNVNAQMHFLLSNSTATETTTNQGATTTVKLIDDQNHTTTFGMNVTSFNDTDYKFIGWYMSDSAAPNAYSVDGHASDFGAARVEPGLAIPPDETTYYALFVPYIKGDLTITHSQRADSAGDADSNEGIGLRIEYYTQPNQADIKVVGSTHCGSTGVASVTLDDTIIDEKNTIGRLAVNVRARPDNASNYKATYREQVKVPDREVQHDDLPGEGYYYAEFDAPVSERFVDSDTVKGLKELRPINYYSVFSRAFEIIYTYTARDGLEKEYKLTGSEDSFEDFELYVIEHTPYVRTLAGDTVWDTDNLVMYEDDHGMHAFLNEVSNVRSRCTVKIIEKGGYTPTLLIPYGETFTDEQAKTHSAPATNDSGQTFDYWEITNTDTGEHIANCYSKDFTFAVWNNYTITPHYTDTPTDIKDEGTFITIDFIDTSRNLWGDAKYNNDDDTTDRTEVTDKVVADLDISFINKGDKILEAVDGNGNNLYKLGVMFEICGNTEDGTFDADAFKEGESGMESRVETLVASNTKPSSTATIGGVNCYYTKIEISENTVSTFNRSEFARSFTTSSVKNRVFRMYAYMITPEGETVLSAPNYITLYEYASPEYAIH